MNWEEFDGKTIFDLNREGAIGADLPNLVNDNKNFTFDVRKDSIGIPSASELDVIRHYTNASRTCFGVENGIYPLGSCTMKYNPKINEDIAQMFKNFHPLDRNKCVQGCMEIIYHTQSLLSCLVGLDETILSPAAGAHAEVAAIMMVKEFHSINNRDYKKVVIIPDSAHGTNESSAALCGYNIIKVKTSNDGFINIEELEGLIDKKTACLMITNPNTFGLFEKDIKKIAEKIHEHDAVLYCDGANFNALIGRANMKEFGVDIMHLNLHKTFSTPHGGGGPGCGALCFSKKFAEFAPYGGVEKCKDGRFRYLEKPKNSIGRIKGVNTINFSACVKAFAYIISIGLKNIALVSENSVLAANYLKRKLQKFYHDPFEDKYCMHEFLLTDKKQLENGTNALCLAKFMINHFVHPMTIYFPIYSDKLGSLLIEITETENKNTIDKFANLMIAASKATKDECMNLKNSPVGKVDEAMASKRFFK